MKKSIIIILVLSVILVSLILLNKYIKSQKHDEIIVQETPVELNFNKSIQNDFIKLSSDSTCLFYRAEAIYDTTIDCGIYKLIKVTSEFLCNDTIVTSIHAIDHDTTLMSPYDGIIINPIQCSDLIPVDSVLNSLDSISYVLFTDRITLIRPNEPPYPENPWYVFGRGLLIIDAVTGEIYNELESIE